MANSDAWNVKQSFSPGEKVHMATNVRTLNGFVEHVDADHVRVRWEDDTIGMLVFKWQLERLEHGWYPAKHAREQK